MALPVMPSTHRWFRTGPGLSRAGRNALFTADGVQVWVWDEETGLPVTDFLDEAGNSIASVPVRNGWVGTGVLRGIGLPVAVRIASFSLGQSGERYELIPVQTLIDAAQVTVDKRSILLDTDGVPYFTDAGAGMFSVSVDTDGVPYFL